MQTGTAISSASNQDMVETPEGNTPAQDQDFWSKEKDAFDKRTRLFLRQGNAIVRRFKDESRGETAGERDAIGISQPFKLNLFWTNITTLQCMLFGSTPKIDVSREHQDPDDDVARVAATMYQRLLEVDVSSSGANLATTLKACLQDRLLPGLGTARVKYGYKSEEDLSLDTTTLEDQESETVTSEWCTTDYVHWQDFAWGWGRTWSEVPWVGFRSYLTKDEATTRFGEDSAKELEYKSQLPTGDAKEADVSDPDQKSNVQKAEVWEFWNRPDRKVYWWSKGASGVLDSKDDPLGLDGFFPCPMPMMANLTTTLTIPRADFVMAQDLYNEIDMLQTRISIITRAVKVVGVYNKNAGDSVGRMLKEGNENNLIPVDNWAMFADGGGLKGNIEWFPTEEVVTTLQTLQSIRDNTIELLYQVTGMSDILRGGDTDQYTSDGTNQLKAKFGSIRVQALQDQFAQFASDLDGLKAEVVSKHFNAESIVMQSSAQFLPQADMDKIPSALELMKSPDVKWRVQIRPESIAMMDYAQLKSERTEYLTATATFLQSATSVVQEVPGSLPVLLEMMKWGLAGFKGANYLEGTLDKAIVMASKPQPEEPDPEQQKLQQAQQMEQMKHQFEMEKIQAKSQADNMLNQQKFQLQMEQMQADHQAKMEQQMAKTQGEVQKIMKDLQSDLQVIAAKLQADVQVEQAQAEGQAAAEQVQFENTVEQSAIEHEFALEEIGASHETAMQLKKAEVESKDESDDD